MAQATGDANARTADDHAGRVLETVVRVAAGLGLLVWCGNILAPFLHAVVWGVLLAVAIAPPFRKAVRMNAGRARATAAMVAVVGVLAVILPMVALSASLAEGAQVFSERLDAGQLDLPPPSPAVADWPVIGGPLFKAWSKGAADIASLAEPLGPYMKSAAGAVLSLAGSLAGAIFQAILAMIIACAFLAHPEWAEGVARGLASRLVGRRGIDFARIATVTIRGVARGVLGVAVIQSTLAGLGFAVIGIPGAGLWALLCLVLCVMQIPIAVVIVPTIIYVFSVEPTTAAVLYTVWGVLVGISDNFLKPFLFGNQVETPVLVLLIGSIGGMIASGVIGLFTGAVILALGYELVYAWINGERRADDEAATGAIDVVTEDPTPST